MTTLRGILRYAEHLLKHKNLIFPGQGRIKNLLDLRIRLAAIRLLYWSNRYRMYQPIPFKEFYDITPARSRACDMRWKEISKHLPERLDGLTVLDLGAAEGYFGFQCAKRGARVTAVEFFPDKSRLIRLIASRFMLNDFSVITGDLSQLDLKSIGQFDFIFYLNIHQHIYKRNPSKANRILSEIKQICRLGIFFESRPVKFHSAIEALSPESPQPFMYIDDMLEIVKDGTGFSNSQELYYEGYDDEPTHKQSIPEGSNNYYRLFYLTIP